MDINYYKKYEPIGGKWHITKELGRGSFGVVYEVERKDFSDTKSAMKILSIPSHPGEIDSYKKENYDLDEASVKEHFYSYVEEFVREFQLMAKLRGHSNIVSYEDHDVIEKTEGIGWDIFIRMELLTPLGEFLSGKIVTEADVIRLATDMCDALRVCHQNKIIHRDIKPSNIFVSDTGSYKLGDFGVAKSLEKASGEMSKKGTYTYMAPEVFKGEEYDMTVDIYSLGIVMYKLLNNNMEPFRTDRIAPGDESVLTRRMKGENIPAPKNASKAMSKIILKACSYNPSERYADVTEMKNDLLALAENPAGNSETENTGPSSEEKPGKAPGTKYDTWFESTEVKFKSVSSPNRWRCPRCDMANDNKDEACFVCGCLKSSYIPPSSKRDSFSSNLNDHDASARVKPVPGGHHTPPPKDRTPPATPVHPHDSGSSGSGAYWGIILFLIVLIAAALLVIGYKINI